MGNTQRDAKTFDSRRRFLIVPGLGGSDSAHWQTHWQHDLNGRRVEQESWHQPDLDAWLARLVEAVRDFPNAVLIAHSLGCILVVHLAKKYPKLPVRGAFLVAPADIEHLRDLTATIASFFPVPRKRLPFPSLVIASTNDPYVPIERARFMAGSWGSDFVNVGPQGHINSGAGFGPWPEGQKRLLEFSDRTLSRQPKWPAVRSNPVREKRLERTAP